MAKAPSPSRVERAHEREDRKETEEQILELPYQGRTLPLSFLDLGPGDDEVSLAQSGSAITGVFIALGENPDKMSLHVVMFMLWFARRKNGEPDLSWQDMKDEFPTYRKMIEAMGGDIEQIKLKVGSADPKDDE